MFIFAFFSLECARCVYKHRRKQWMDQILKTSATKPRSFCSDFKAEQPCASHRNSHRPPQHQPYLRTKTYLCQTHSYHLIHVPQEGEYAASSMRLLEICTHCFVLWWSTVFQSHLQVSSVELLIISHAHHQLPWNYGCSDFIFPFLWGI